MARCGAFRARAAIQEIGYLCGHPIRRELQRFVDMDVALGNAAGRVAEQRRDRQLRKSEIAGHAGEGVAQRVWRDVVQPGARADAVENAHDADEMPFAPIGGEEEGRFRLWLIEQQFNCRAPDDPCLGAALGVRKPDRPLFLIEPRALQTQGFHAPEAG